MEETDLSGETWDDLVELASEDEGGGGGGGGGGAGVEATRRLIVATDAHGEIMKRLTWALVFFTTVLVIFGAVQVGVILD